MFPGGKSRQFSRVLNSMKTWMVQMVNQAFTKSMFYFISGDVS